MTEFHDEFTDLLGAFALDAVDPDEQLRIETHLHSCPFCSAEVIEHREVAAYLVQTGADAPEGVWDRISAELSPPAPPLRMSFSRDGDIDPLAAPVEQPASPDPAPPAAPDNVVSLAERRSVRTRTMVAVLGVAAVLLAVLGFVAVDQYRSANDLRDEASSVITPGPGDLSVGLESSTKAFDARALVNDQGEGVLIPHDLPRLSDETLYQLWGRVDGRNISLGTFSAKTESVKFQLDPDRLPDLEAFAITKERAPGAQAATLPPVLVGEVA